MLIKLTSVPNPDLNGGQSQPCYIDASRVLLITQGSFRFAKADSVEAKRKLADDLYGAAMKLSDAVGGYTPSMTDPVAVEWMQRARETSSLVTKAYTDWSRSWNVDDQHPRVDCTEVQLACGTALEHGVMLIRVWVTERPEEVAHRVENAMRLLAEARR